jgi:hypothetical protein
MPGDFSRQSFLGEKSQAVIEETTLGFVGLGGGGSHLVQQAAHIGFLKYVIADPDLIEDSNLNRLVGGTAAAVAKSEAKVDIAERLIKGIRAGTEVKKIKSKWQDNPELLRRCDILFGAIDGFDARRQLESFARRNLIPLIDIGMDVVTVAPEPPQMVGQAILSMPGYACMTCMGFLNERSLAAEAAKYGDAGGAPQVVWPNGLLASTAIGIAVDLLTDWSKSLRLPLYLTYRGNTHSLAPHSRVPYIQMRECAHYPLRDIGPPRFRSL